MNTTETNNINPGYVEFLRANNKLLLANNDRLCEKLDRLEFETRRILTDLIDLKQQCGYYGSKTTTSRFKYEDFDDIPF